MEFQVMKNDRGIRNLYFGHPFSKETYTNSVVLRTSIESWVADFDGVYSGKVIEVRPETESLVDSENVEMERRVIRGTKVMFIGDHRKVLEMEDDIQVYRNYCNKAMIKVNNPEYLEFEAYTEKVLKDPLKNIFDLKYVDAVQAKKYMDYAVQYDKNTRYSDKLILKPYFASTDSGVLLLMEDFVDFIVDLRVDVETGVIGFDVQIAENTSKYTANYKEI